MKMKVVMYRSVRAASMAARAGGLDTISSSSIQNQIWFHLLQNQVWSQRPFISDWAVSWQVHDDDIYDDIYDDIDDIIQFHFIPHPHCWFASGHRSEECQLFECLMGHQWHKSIVIYQETISFSPIPGAFMFNYLLRHRNKKQDELIKF